MLAAELSEASLISFVRSIVMLEQEESSKHIAKPSIDKRVFMAGCLS
jgi:hypothetical protein